MGLTKYITRTNVALMNKYMKPDPIFGIDSFDSNPRSSSCGENASSVSASKLKKSPTNLSDGSRSNYAKLSSVLFIKRTMPGTLTETSDNIKRDDMAFIKPQSCAKSPLL